MRSHFQRIFMIQHMKIEIIASSTYGSLSCQVHYWGRCSWNPTQKAPQGAITWITKNILIGCHQWPQSRIYFWDYFSCNSYLGGFPQSQNVKYWKLNVKIQVSVPCGAFWAWNTAGITQKINSVTQGTPYLILLRSTKVSLILRIFSDRWYLHANNRPPPHPLVSGRSDQKTTNHQLNSISQSTTKEGGGLLLNVFLYCTRFIRFKDAEFIIESSFYTLIIIWVWPLWWHATS